MASAPSTIPTSTSRTSTLSSSSSVLRSLGLRRTRAMQLQPPPQPLWGEAPPRTSSPCGRCPAASSPAMTRQTHRSASSSALPSLEPPTSGAAGEGALDAGRLHRLAPRARPPGEARRAAEHPPTARRAAARRRQRDRLAAYRGRRHAGRLSDQDLPPQELKLDYNTCGRSGHWGTGKGRSC